MRLTTKYGNQHATKQTITDTDIRTTWRFDDIMKRFGNSENTSETAGVTWLSLDAPLTVTTTRRGRTFAVY